MIQPPWLKIPSILILLRTTVNMSGKSAGHGSYKDFVWIGIESTTAPCPSRISSCTAGNPLEPQAQALESLTAGGVPLLAELAHQARWTTAGWGCGGLFVVWYRVQGDAFDSRYVNTPMSQRN